MTYYEVVEERGDYRAVIVADECAEAPEHDSGCPVLEVPSHGGSVRDTGYGGDSYKHDGLSRPAEDVLQHFITTTPDGVETFGRYLRVFHNGNAKVVYRGGWHESDYVAYITENMIRESWGNTSGKVPEAEADEWVSYLEGDVWGVRVEQRVTTETITRTRLNGEEVSRVTGESWETVEDSEVWGHYGSEWAEEAALDQLSYYAPKQSD